MPRLLRTFGIPGAELGIFWHFFRIGFRIDHDMDYADDADERQLAADRSLLLPNMKFAKF